MRLGTRGACRLGGDPDGDKYEGQVDEDGKPHGIGTYKWSDGEKITGEWKDDEIDGLAMYTWPNGSKFVGEYKDSERNGLGVLMAPDGRVEGGVWVNGVQTSRRTP